MCFNGFQCELKWGLTNAMRNIIRLSMSRGSCERAEYTLLTYIPIVNFTVEQKYSETKSKHVLFIRRTPACSFIALFITLILSVINSALCMQLQYLVHVPDALLNEVNYSYWPPSFH